VLVVLTYLISFFFTQILVSNMRPDIYLSVKDERELFLIRKGSELNATGSYEMVTLAPRIRAQYDKKKIYCPKYQVHFYMEVPMLFQLYGDRFT